MSEAIEGLSYIQADPLIVVPNKQIITPKYKNLIKFHPNNRKRNSQIWTEQALMMKLFKKFNDQQLSKIQIQNNIIIKKKIDGLKRRMRKSAEDITNQKSIDNCFNENKKQRNSLRNILKENRDNIDLAKKYRTKIVNKMSTIQEVKQIVKQKIIYRQWLNSHNNSPIKSPNFARMNFALQRAQRKRQQEGVSQRKKKQFSQIVFRKNSNHSCYIAKKNNKFKCSFLKFS